MAKPLSSQKDCNRLTAAALTRMCGLAKGSLLQWHRKEGMERNGDGTYSLPDVIHWLIDRAKTERRRIQDENDDNLDRLRGYRADREAIRLRQDRHELVEMELVERMWQKHVTDARTILQTIPDAIGLLISDDDQRSLLVPEVERIVHDGLLALAEARVDRPVNGGGRMKSEY